jgi:hypothetical protein
MQIDRYVADRRRRQKKRHKYFWAIAAFLAVYFVAFGIFYLIVGSPAFHAERITVVGNSAVPTPQIMGLLQSSIIREDALLTKPNSGLKAMLGFNNLLIWPDALPTSTVAAIPQLDGVTIAKNYFLHTITVAVAERQPFAIWCQMPADDCYWFDNTGIAFEHTLDTEGGAIDVIHDYSGVSSASSTVAVVVPPLTLGQPVLAPEFMPNLISILNVLQQSNVGVEDISLQDISLQQINVTTVDGPMLYFSLRFSADEDLPVLQNLIAQPGFDKLQYIDFTVENRAYYK